MKLFSGSTNFDFAHRVSQHLDCTLSSLKLDRFKDGDITSLLKTGDNVIINPSCGYVEIV